MRRALCCIIQRDGCEVCVCNLFLLNRPTTHTSRQPTMGIPGAVCGAMCVAVCGYFKWDPPVSISCQKSTVRTRAHTHTHTQAHTHAHTYAHTHTHTTLFQVRDPRTDFLWKEQYVLSLRKLLENALQHALQHILQHTLNTHCRLKHAILYNPEGLSKDLFTPARTERLSPCVAVRCSVLHTHLPNTRVCGSPKHKAYTRSCTGSYSQCVAVHCSAVYTHTPNNRVFESPKHKAYTLSCTEGYRQCEKVCCTHNYQIIGSLNRPDTRHILYRAKKVQSVTLAVWFPQSVITKEPLLIGLSCGK